MKKYEKKEGRNDGRSCIKKVGSEKEKVAEKYREITATSIDEARETIEYLAQGNMIILMVPDVQNILFVIQKFSETGALAIENTQNIEVLIPL